MPRKVSLLAIVIEDRQQLSWTIVRFEPVRGHRGELDGLARVHEDRSRAEQELHDSAEYGEPLVSRMYLRIGDLAFFSDAHLGDRDTASISLPREQPESRAAPRFGFGADDDIVDAFRLDELIERGAERLRNRDQLFQRDPLVSRLDAAERRRRKEAARCERLKRPRARQAQAANALPDDRFSFFLRHMQKLMRVKG